KIRILSNLLEAPAILTNFSRLLIDCNRGKDDPTLISCLSDGTIVPGNIQLSTTSISHRIEHFYDPYHKAIATTINQALLKNIVPSLISIHTFTPQWKGTARPWHAGILWDKDPRLAEPLIKELRKLSDIIIGNNEPYRGWLRGDTLWKHGTQRGVPHVLIEIRQDLLRNETSIHKWGDTLSSIILSILSDTNLNKDLSKLILYGSKTDKDSLNF
ncbi:MAG: N-formylglutamate amidohydrolase, partial [Hyphomicrobium sp.]